MPYLTARPASLRAFAVPPEAIRCKPTEARFLANSTRPVLSETLNKAETENISHHSLYTLHSSRPGRGRVGSRESQGPHYPDLDPGPGLPPANRTSAGRGLADRSAASHPAGLPQLPPGRRHCRGEGAAEHGCRWRGTSRAPRGSPSWPGAMAAGGKAPGSAGHKSGDATCGRRGGAARIYAGRRRGGPGGRLIRHVTQPAPCSISDAKLEPQGCKGMRGGVRCSWLPKSRTGRDHRLQSHTPRVICPCPQNVVAPSLGS